MQIPHTGSLTYDEAQPERFPRRRSARRRADARAISSRRKVPMRVTLEMAAHMEPDADSSRRDGRDSGPRASRRSGRARRAPGFMGRRTGAQDDGSGIMASLQAVAMIKKLGLRAAADHSGGVLGERRKRRARRARRIEQVELGDTRCANHVAAIEMDGGAETPRGFGYGAEAGAGAAAEMPLRRSRRRPSRRFDGKTARDRKAARPDRRGRDHARRRRIGYRAAHPRRRAEPGAAHRRARIISTGITPKPTRSTKWIRKIFARISRRWPS